ncbi:cytoplasmic polyadenylation element-binding protein 1 isoform X2 [Anthonomus grandis grandis]|uniref:cytoplasmic polyadenylation element-binding protein 1 isoform X2 n=1 Tax=Anthonomus grandis grandis TaxID=2921223 RepID=UPI002165FDD5|nr:cytoplasmic polyadenylation element-binding protein 1 isoform X2 [Anthonomus grandis grandis]
MADDMSIPDLLGLNSPRGLLNVGSSDALYNLCTPPASPQSTMGNIDETRMQSEQLHHNGTTSMKNLQRNWSLGSTGSSNWATPTQTPRAIRSISFSDSCENNPSNSYPLLNRSSSTYDASHSYGAVGVNNNTPDVLSNLLNSMTLADNLSKNLSPTGLSDVELSNLQNLQALNTLKYLQQPTAFLNPLSPLSPQAGLQLEKWNLNGETLSPTSECYQLEKAARFHRTAASVYDAVCTWSGVLPAQTVKSAGFSSKVFLGGVPWDITEQCLVQAFRPFGHVKVEWPGKERHISQPKGYAYIVMESEKAVKALLLACTHDYINSGNFYYKIGAKRMKTKDVQVIPWYLSDSNYTKSASQKLDPTKTVFVGALHGMLTAHGLAKIMNDLFDGVVYAGIDTDKYKYPIGSGRVTFNNSRSYMKAVRTGFINVKTTKFIKKVQVDPYLEDSLCSFCNVQQGPYFCRNGACFRYFCRPCWVYYHDSGLMRSHTPMSRNSKNNQLGLEFPSNAVATI